MAQIAKSETDKATEITHEVTNQAEDTARDSLKLVRRTVDAAAEVERQTARRAAEGTAKLSQVLVNLLKEQTEHNLTTLRALTGAVDWDQVAKAVDWERVVQIQSEYLRVSLERTAQLTQRYFEVSQAVWASALSTARDQVRKAA